MTTTTPLDARGLQLRVGDRVRITSYGWAIRKVDVGYDAWVDGFTARGLVKLTNAVEGPAGTDLANGKAVHGTCLTKVTEDGTRHVANVIVDRARFLLGYTGGSAVSGIELVELQLKLEALDAQSCDACDAESGESCNPGCLGVAAQQDEPFIATATYHDGVQLTGPDTDDEPAVLAPSPDQQERSHDEDAPMVAQTLSFGPDLPTTFAGAVRGLLAATPDTHLVARLTPDRGEPYDVQLVKVTSDRELYDGGWQLTLPAYQRDYVVVQRWDADADEAISRSVELVPLDEISDILVY